MKPSQFLFSVFLSLNIGGALVAQTSHPNQLIFPLLVPEIQSNLVITADERHSKSCPPELTNLISNTNLISPAERATLEKIPARYRNVTSNSGPPGAVFEGWRSRRWGHEDLVGDLPPFQVAHFSYTNPAATEDIKWGTISTQAKYRTLEGDGYDVVLVKGSLCYFQQYKNWVLDGLFLGMHDPNHPDSDPHFGMWMRFSKGKAVGKAICWRRYQDDSGGIESRIVAEAEFKEPFDFLKYQSIPIDLAWSEVPTNINKSIQNP